MSLASELASSVALLPWRRRNALIESLFYDISSLAPVERAMLTSMLEREGSIVVVSPSVSGRPIRRYKKALRFMNKEGDNVQAIALAGVGSSALGTAALARNVADATGFDVAGIVTGYGLTDLVTEALGGWFVFGAADYGRFVWETFLERAATTVPEMMATAAEHGPARRQADTPSGALVEPGNYEVSTLVDILMARPRNLELLVGHSRGSLLIDFVLEQFVDELEGDDHPLFEQLRIVTLGTVVSLPRPFKQVKQYLGELDWFGGINSRLGVPHEKVAGAWHHLNRRLPYHLDVVQLLTP